MDYYNEYSNNKSNNYSDKSNYVKKITQILLSVSVFSLFFSQSSLVVHSYDYLVSNFNFKLKLFTYTTERNCIFLLCNGILVLIMQSSGLISKITPVKSGAAVDDEVARFQETEKKGVGKAQILEEKLRENEVAELVDEDEDYGMEEEEDDDDEEEGGIDTDELNKKFEDFIKKMKQEIQGP